MNVCIHVHVYIYIYVDINTHTYGDNEAAAVSHCNNHILGSYQGGGKTEIIEIETSETLISRAYSSGA